MKAHLIDKDTEVKSLAQIPEQASGRAQIGK